MSSPKAVHLFGRDESWYSHPAYPEGLFRYDPYGPDNSKPASGYDADHGHIVFDGSDHLVGILMEMCDSSASAKSAFRMIPKRFFARCTGDDAALAMRILAELYRRCLVVAVYFDGDYMFQLSYQGSELAKAFRGMLRDGSILGCREIRIRDGRFVLLGEPPLPFLFESITGSGGSPRTGVRLSGGRRGSQKKMGGVLPPCFIRGPSLGFPGTSPHPPCPCTCRAGRHTPWPSPCSWD